MAGAGLAGAGLMAGTASAGSNQVGTIGSASQPVDLESEDINNADTVTTNTLDAVSVNTDETVINNVPILMESFQDVNDNTSVTLNVSEFELINISTSFGGCTGIFFTRFNGIDNFIFGRSMSSQGGTPLTGTTGPDGDLNVSRVGNTLHIENRLGSQRDVVIFSFKRNPL